MKVFEDISIVQTAAGGVIFLCSIVMALRIKDHALKGLSREWVLTIMLMASVFLVYFFYLFSLLIDMSLPQELITGTVLLTNALFVYVFVSFAKTGIDRLGKETAARRELEDRLKAFSLTDELTGLYSKRAFLTLMENHLKIAKRQRTKVLMFYADVDGLRNINNAQGPQEGDMLLTETANLLKATFRKSDIIARVGEDEFAVFLVGAREEHAGTITGNFLNNLECHNVKRLQRYKLSLSYSLIPFDPAFNDSTDSILTCAHESMLEQKKQKHAFN
ncbi:MAG: GGDEF domain-containing protein [Nitrospiraceae bacterium]|nr:MAG: GGDEF domain-containing protein [Nitrospiraceae bacterium]